MAEGAGLLGGIVAALLALPAACDLPRDPGRTLQRIAGERIVAVQVSPALTAAEAAALEALAADLGAGLDLLQGDLHAGVDALHSGRAQVVLGAIPADSPHAPEAAATRPFGRERFVMLLPPGENALLLAANRAAARAAERIAAEAGP